MKSLPFSTPTTSAQPPFPDPDLRPAAFLHLLSSSPAPLEHVPSSLHCTGQYSPHPSPISPPPTTFTHRNCQYSLRCSRPAVVIVTLVSLLIFLSHLTMVSSSSSSSDQHQQQRQRGQQLVYRVEEERPINTIIGNVKEDSDLGSKFSSSPSQAAAFASLHFALYQANNAVADLVSLDTATGVLTTRVEIDRETLCTVPHDDCDVMLVDVMVLPYIYFQIIKVKIIVMDINDHAPVFPSVHLDWTMSESAAVGAEFPLPTADDPDSGPRGVQIYELVNEHDSLFDLLIANHSSAHSLAPGQGQLDVSLVLRGQLDRETTSLYSVQINAWDGGRPPLRGSIWINIHVADTNDNSPVFDSVLYDVSLAEHSPAGTEVVRVHATDADEGAYGQVTYRLAPETETHYGHVFAINNRTGRIYVRRDGVLDREDRDVYVLDVMAMDDEGQGTLPTFAKVTVHVQDVNDNAPHIVINTLTETGYAQVMENLPAGTFVAHVTVSDPDLGMSGEFDCAFDNNHFALQRLSGGDYKMISTVTFDREAKDAYVVTVTCHDGSVPRMTSSKKVIVRIADENDNVPYFDKDVYVVPVKEGNNIDVLLVRLNATDSDAGKNGVVRYSVADNDVIYVDPATGVVRAKVSFDFETKTHFQFIVTVTDSNERPLSSTAIVALNIIDINDNAPQFLQDKYEFIVFENAPINSIVGTVNASDADSLGHTIILYTIDPPEPLFSVDATKGVVVTRGRLDREICEIYTLRLVAYNPELPDNRGDAIVVVRVSDVNDNAPIVVFPSELNSTAYVSTRAPQGYVMTSIVAYDRDVGDNSRLTYAVDTSHSDFTASRLFNVSADSGHVVVTGNVTTRDSLVVRLRIVIRDLGLPPLATSVDLYIVVSERALLEYDAVMAAENGDDSDPMTRSKLVVAVGIVCGTLAVVLVIAVSMCLAHCREMERRRTRLLKGEHGDNGGGNGCAVLLTDQSPADCVLHNPLLKQELGCRGGDANVYQQCRLLQNFAAAGDTILDNGGAYLSPSKCLASPTHGMTLTLTRGRNPISTSDVMCSASPTPDGQCSAQNEYCTRGCLLVTPSARGESDSDSGQGASDEGDTSCCHRLPTIDHSNHSLGVLHNTTGTLLRETQQKGQYEQCYPPCYCASLFPPSQLMPSSPSQISAQVVTPAAWDESYINQLVYPMMRSFDYISVTTGGACSTFRKPV